jgi:hypothetical protein
LIWLRGRIVTFRLSSPGKRELERFFDTGSFQAFVADADDYGAWLVFDGENPSETTPWFLLKWDYVATASVEIPVEPDEPVRKKPIGFQ